MPASSPSPSPGSSASVSPTRPPPKLRRLPTHHAPAAVVRRANPSPSKTLANPAVARSYSLAHASVKQEEGSEEPSIAAPTPAPSTATVQGLSSIAVEVISSGATTDSSGKLSLSLDLLAESPLKQAPKPTRRATLKARMPSMVAKATPSTASASGESASETVASLDLSSSRTPARGKRRKVSAEPSAVDAMDLLEDI
eukprot:m.523698 g.523698  ORF g.523698 m.523698 type:complete len:198 (+) comp57527_c0_seq7:932-1525(+)